MRYTQYTASDHYDAEHWEVFDVLTEQEAAEGACDLFGCAIVYVRTNGGDPQAWARVDGRMEMWT